MSSDEHEICIVCLERPVDTCVTPCMHKVLCVRCLTRLSNCRCPLCRKLLGQVYLPSNIPEPRKRALPEILRARDMVDNFFRSNTIQILLPATVRTHSAAHTLLQQILKSFPLQQRSLNVKDAMRVLHNGFGDSLDGMPIDCRFAPNACVAGANVRFSVFPLPYLVVRLTYSACHYFWREKCALFSLSLSIYIHSVY